MATVETSFARRTKPSDRIKRLRAKTLTNPPGCWEVGLHGAESWRATVGEPWWVVRRGMRAAHVLRNLEIVIDPDDLLVGRYTHRAPTAEEFERLEVGGKFMAAQPVAWGQAGHMQPDFDELLTHGCRGLQARIDGLSSDLDPAAPESSRRLAFYRAARAALDGLCDFAERHAEEAERLAGECSDPGRAEELREIAAVCRRVPAEPASTFHEALQAAHFLLFAANIVEGCGLTSPGSIDRWLAAYLRADLESGRLALDDAQELLDNFFLTFNWYIGHGLAIGNLIGGRDAEGRDICNEVTWMALHATDHVRLAYPSTGLRVHTGTDPALIDLALELLSEGATQPALFNDEVITASLLDIGLPREDACDYMNSTCVEITPSGKSNVWVACPYYNLPQVVLDVIDDVASGRLAEPQDLDAVIGEFSQRLSAQIAAGVAQYNALRHACEAHRNFPLASCFVQDCLERGADIDAGGARYNWIECSFVGLATASDSLEALRQFVLEGDDLSWTDLHTMLQADFEGHEPWRQRMLHEPAKYGNADATVDELAQRILEGAIESCHGHRVVLGGTYEPGLFAWIQHGELGKVTGATPDGRRAGECLSPGPDPMPGRATSGPTAAVLSATSFPHQPFIGGVAFNLKFSPSTLSSPDRREKLAALVHTYFERGGFQTQINVVSAGTLRAAQGAPEEHADLLVRVAGYSDYFVHLTPQMQEEIIARTESDL